MWSFVKPKSGFLKKRELKRLEVLFEVIIPRDVSRSIPGAKDANATKFVSYLLAMDESVYVEIPKWRDMYPRYLNFIADYFLDRYDISLEEGPFSQRQELLENLQEGQLDIPGVFEGKLFFKTLLRHCIQGCFSDPRWSGNQDKIMWRWIGYMTDPEEVLENEST